MAEAIRVWQRVTIEGAFGDEDPCRGRVTAVETLNTHIATVLESRGSKVWVSLEGDKVKKVEVLRISEAIVEIEPTHLFPVFLGDHLLAVAITYHEPLKKGDCLV